ncbi:MAG TPA: PQQ-dependent sugar dehydrogenase, partial [Thermoanaerobaculia bacterium]|nr:PQQ-dependent sugar dehydrogenase [Thermoanaerobaculia bacterium]
YVANADAVVRFPYRDGATSISDAPTKVGDLPAGINHHWTKSMVMKDGRLYVGVGSNSNVAEKGMDVEKDRAAVLVMDPATGRTRVFASGLRNPVGIAFEPSSGALWAVVNERDELGSDLVPDYLTSVQEGAFYGWPYSYYGQHVDDRVQPPRPDLVASATVPDFALGAHTGSLGLVFHDGGAYVGQHGSWNRRPLAGYRVIFIPFANGRPGGEAQEILTGFVDDHGDARGRPVGVTVDAKGALLVADDVGNAVWRVTH